MLQQPMAVYQGPPWRCLAVGTKSMVDLSGPAGCAEKGFNGAVRKDLGVLGIGLRLIPAWSFGQK